MHKLIINPEKLLKVDEAFVKKVLMMIDYLNTPCFVVSSTEGPHTRESFHYEGKAIDLIFPEYKGSLFSLYLICERFSFSGIGLYPKMKMNGEIRGGIHLDERVIKEGEQRPRWIGIPEFREEVQKMRIAYYPMNPPNMIRLKILTKVEV